MRTTDVTRRNPDRTRERLLEAGFMEIYSRGFQPAGLDAIVERAERHQGRALPSLLQQARARLRGAGRGDRPLHRSAVARPDPRRRRSAHRDCRHHARSVQDRLRARLPAEQPVAGNVAHGRGLPPAHRRALSPLGRRCRGGSRRRTAARPRRSKPSTSTTRRPSSSRASKAPTASRRAGRIARRSWRAWPASRDSSKASEPGTLTMSARHSSGPTRATSAI